MSGSVAHPSSPHALTIRPPSGWSGVALREVWDYRELLYFLTKRELQIRYKQSVLGASWVILQPVVLTFVLALFFGRIANVATDTPNIAFPVFALAGLTPWLYVAVATNEASGSLVADSELLSKVYFPRIVIPLAKALSHLIDLAVSFGVLLAFGVIYGISFPLTVILTPLFLLLAIVTAVGAGIYYAALNVKYRDVQVVVPVLVQIWFFMTPVIYPGSLVGGGVLKYAYALNPMVSAINGVRWSFLGATAPDVGEVAASVGGAIFMLALALLYFRRSETYFADVI
jgi:lipopolysaccharide transport system permease protein